VEDAEVTVRAGERCDVDLRRHTMQLSRVEAPRVAQAVPALAPAPPPGAAADVALAAPKDSVPRAHLPVHSPSARAGRARWTALEEQARYEEAFAAVEEAGVERVIGGAGADELLRLARLARAVGSTTVAQRALLGARARFAGSRVAAVAAYELGRAAPAPAEAARWFALFLAEQPDGALAPQASGRLVEALAAAGRRAEAVAAARRYLALHPEGPYAALAHRLISE
jgi:hypothetical protein